MFNTIFFIFFTVFFVLPAAILVVTVLFLGLESLHYGLSKNFPFKGFKHVIDDAHNFVKQHLTAAQQGTRKLHH